MSVEKVSFQNVQGIYTADSDITVYYVLAANVTAKSTDRVALYCVGYGSSQDYLTYQWAPAPSRDHINNQLPISVVFKASSLPKDTGEFFRFGYVTHDGQIIGVSTSFQFHDEGSLAVSDKIKTMALQDILKETEDKLKDTEDKLQQTEEKLNKAEEEKNVYEERLNIVTLDNEQLRTRIQQFKNRIKQLESVQENENSGQEAAKRNAGDLSDEQQAAKAENQALSLANLQLVMNKKRYQSMNPELKYLLGSVVEDEPDDDFHCTSDSDDSPALTDLGVTCPMCDLAFHTGAIRLLEEHIDSHLEHECPICSMAFQGNNSKKFKEHVRKHFEGDVEDIENPLEDPSGPWGRSFRAARLLEID